MSLQNCPSCGKSHPNKLRQPWLVACAHCGARIEGVPGLPAKYFGLVDDWSPIKIGTTGRYKDKSFEVTGRVRLLFKSDFRNLWCASYEGGMLWICQSLESIGFFPCEFTRYPAEFNPPNCGTQIAFSEETRLKTELVDTCLSVTFQGEVARFPYPTHPIKLIQARNSQRNTVLICWKEQDNCEFLWGELMMPAGIALQNTRSFDDW